MNAWFNVKNFDINDQDRADNLHILESVKKIYNIVDEAVSRWHSGDYTKIFVGGFSQGCSIAFLVSLFLPQVIGGVIGYSGRQVPLYF
jgi:predicted esterase